MKYEDVRIGQRVHFVGGRVTGPCQGAVIGLYPPDPSTEGDPGGAVIRVDELPERWPYKDNLFAPDVDEIELVSEARQ